MPSNKGARKELHELIKQVSEKPDLNEYAPVALLRKKYGLK